MNSERQDLDMQLKKNSHHTILVSGASGIVGYGILRSLKEQDYKLIGTTIYKESPADCFSDIVEHPPMTHDEGYIPWLIDTIEKYHIDMIIPAIEADMEVWNKNREKLQNTGTYVLLNNSGLIDLCLDKWHFYQALKDNHFKYCIDSTIDAEHVTYSYPFILKPRCGFGGRGIVVVKDEEMFNKYRKRIPEDNYMIQEFVGTSDEEYTVSGFFDNQSNLKACIMMKRQLSKQGFTEISKVVNIDEIKKIIIELADIFHPVGPTNFQFRRHEGDWRLLEMNPRISSSTSIRKSFNYNESLMSIEYFLENKEVKQPLIKQGKAIRYTEDYIIYDSANI